MVTEPKKERENQWATTGRTPGRPRKMPGLLLGGDPKPNIRLYLGKTELYPPDFGEGIAAAFAALPHSAPLRKKGKRNELSAP